VLSTFKIFIIFDIIKKVKIRKLLNVSKNSQRIIGFS